MTVTTNRQVTVQLTLSEAEAEWLSGLLQNSVLGCLESESELTMRSGMFSALREALHK